MNNQPNPLIPEGSFLEQKNKGRARVKIAVFFVLAVHGIGLMALLMQGCRREEAPLPPETVESTNTAAPPTFDSTNVVATTNDSLVATNAQVVDTNPPPPVIDNTALTQTPTAGGMTEYIVAPGDTFSSIAKTHHVTVKALQEANPNVVPTKLQIKQKIMVPAPSTTTAPSTNTGAAAPAPGSPIIYTVKSGDTLSRIATQYHVTVRAIRSANNLTTDSLKVNQKLKIPVKTPAPTSAPAPQ